MESENRLGEVIEVSTAVLTILDHFLTVTLGAAYLLRPSPEGARSGSI